MDIQKATSSSSNTEQKTISKWNLVLRAKDYLAKQRQAKIEKLYDNPRSIIGGKPGSTITQYQLDKVMSLEKKPAKRVDILSKLILEDTDHRSISAREEDLGMLHSENPAQIMNLRDFFFNGTVPDNIKNRLDTSEQKIIREHGISGVARMIVLDSTNTSTEGQTNKILKNIPFILNSAIKLYESEHGNPLMLYTSVNLLKSFARGE